MKTIWKFTIPLTAIPIMMPKNAKILSVGMQEGEIKMWALVNPDALEIEHLLPVYGTGHSIKPQHADLPLVGTVFYKILVFHIFDGGESQSSQRSRTNSASASAPRGGCAPGRKPGGQSCPSGARPAICP